MLEDLQWCKMINYVVSDVREYPVSGSKIIPHCCNDIHAMGSGVAAALSKKWPIVKKTYMENECKLGQCYLIPVEDNTYVANMIGQHKVMCKKIDGVSLGEDNRPPVRYLALSLAMNQLRVLAKSLIDVHIVAPKFAADLAGGNWSFIETLIKELWLPYFPVTICCISESDLPDSI